MQVLRLDPAKKRFAHVVRNLRFVANGSELLSWVDEDNRLTGDPFCIDGLFSTSMVSGISQRVELGMLADICGQEASTVCSRDGRYLSTLAEIEESPWTLIEVQDRHSPANLPEIPTTRLATGGLFFTPDCRALIAIRSIAQNGNNAFEIAQFEIAQLTAPPKRFEEYRNSFTGQVGQRPVWNLKWKTLIAHFEWQGVTGAAISDNGRFLAVGEVTGTLHVVDLKRKRAVANIPPETRMVRDRMAVRIAFDSAADWIVRLAGEKLFARSLVSEKSWRTKSSLGNVLDFAIHPTGSILCSVWADGQARYLDLQTGAVKQAFRWSKKPLYSVAFSPDGLTCAAGGESGQVVIWDVDA